jgi:hypothetical protein
MPTRKVEAGYRLVTKKARVSAPGVNSKAC